MKKRRMISLILVTAFVVSLLAGCASAETKLLDSYKDFSGFASVEEIWSPDEFEAIAACIGDDISNPESNSARAAELIKTAFAAGSSLVTTAGVEAYQNVFGYLMGSDKLSDEQKRFVAENDAGYLQRAIMWHYASGTYSKTYTPDDFSELGSLTGYDDLDKGIIEQVGADAASCANFVDTAFFARFADLGVELPDSYFEKNYLLNTDLYSYLSSFKNLDSASRNYHMSLLKKAVKMNTKVDFADLAKPLLYAEKYSDLYEFAVGSGAGDYDLPEDIAELVMGLYDVSSDKWEMTPDAFKIATKCEGYFADTAKSRTVYTYENSESGSEIKGYLPSLTTTKFPREARYYLVYSGEKKLARTVTFTLNLSGIPTELRDLFQKEIVIKYYALTYKYTLYDTITGKQAGTKTIKCSPPSARSMSYADGIAAELTGISGELSDKQKDDIQKWIDKLIKE